MKPQESTPCEYYKDLIPHHNTLLHGYLEVHTDDLQTLNRRLSCLRSSEAHLRGKRKRIAAATCSLFGKNAWRILSFIGSDKYEYMKTRILMGFGVADRLFSYDGFSIERSQKSNMFKYRAHKDRLPSLWVSSSEGKDLIRFHLYCRGVPVFIEYLADGKMGRLYIFPLETDIAKEEDSSDSIDSDDSFRFFHSYRPSASTNTGVNDSGVEGVRVRHPFTSMASSKKDGFFPLSDSYFEEFRRDVANSCGLNVLPGALGFDT